MSLPGIIDPQPSGDVLSRFEMTALRGICYLLIGPLLVGFYPIGLAGDWLLGVWSRNKKTLVDPLHQPIERG